jgi:O-antigen/teichoic acid export membrane protein
VREELEGQTGESHARTVFRHSLMTIGTRIGIVLINVPTSILVARLLGTEGQGTYASAVIFPTVFAFIGLLGVDSAHTFLLSKKRYSLGQINGQSLLLTIALSAVIVPSYLVFVRLYRAADDPDLGRILTLASALIPVLLAKYFSVALLLGLHRIKRFNLANMTQAAMLLAFMCLNLFVFRGGARGALIAYLASEVTVSLVALAVARRAAGSTPLIERPPRGLLKWSAGYGLRGHIGNILVQFTYRLDMFLVLAMVGLQAQGLYSISVILAEKLSHIPQSVQVVLFPKLSSLDTEEANELTPRVTRNALFLTAVAGVVLYLLSRPLLLLFYGTQYLAALQAFQILIPGVVMLSIATILAGDFSGRDRRVYHTIAAAIAFSVNAVLCILWIPRFGIIGAAWASTVAYTLQSLIMLVFFRMLTGRTLSETFLVRREDLSLYAAFVRRQLSRWRGGA